MKHVVTTAVLSVAISLLVGCGGTGQTIPMAIDLKNVPDPEPVRNAPRVAVVPFEDVRADTTAIGRHQHYIETTVDRIVPKEGSAADQITKFVAQYLKEAGFPVTVVQPGAQPTADKADVIMTGEIESYWNEAVSRLGRTELRSKNRLRIKLTNLTDESTTSTTVAGEADTKVVTFEPSDLAQLDGEALGQSMARLLADLKVVERSLKPKPAG
ncbi:MAG TPA: hypothetical protein VGJ57_03480 [Nitrospirales bacterium]